MFLWCRQCQSFLDEVAPYENYDLTFGQCDPCRNLNRNGNPDALIRMRPIAILHQKLRDVAFHGTSPAVDEILAEAAALDVRPPDILFGLLQPCLYEIGLAWSRGRIRAADEHRFTALVNDLLTRIDSLAPKTDGSRRRPLDVLLVVAEGNHHTLGIRMLSFLLRMEHFTCEAYYPGLPKEDVSALVCQFRPRILGISAVTASELLWTAELANELALRSSTPPDLRIAVGGLAVRAARTFPESNLLTFHGAAGFLDFCRRLRSPSSPHSAPRQLGNTGGR